MTTIKIGITGGIGSGKSVVSRLLEVMGIPVYISDIESKRLTQFDTVIREKLVALLGEEVYNKEGELNKPYLASYIFSHPDHAKQVNAIIHPRVKDDFRRWVSEHSDCAIVGMESAILVEAGFAGEVDAVVMVYAPLEVRLHRAMKRDSSPKELIQKRIQSQMDDEEKKLHAHYVIKNDDESMLIPQVMELVALLKKERLS